jgi:hypothetical protein
MRYANASSPSSIRRSPRFRCSRIRISVVGCVRVTDALVNEAAKAGFAVRAALVDAGHEVVRTGGCYRAGIYEYGHGDPKSTEHEPPEAWVSGNLRVCGGVATGVKRSRTMAAGRARSLTART